MDVKELKQIDDLSPYRDWFIKLLKETDKLQQTIDSDFVQQFCQMQQAQKQLMEVCVKNEELEQKVKRLQGKLGNGAGMYRTHSAISDNDMSGIHGSHDGFNDQYSRVQAEPSVDRAYMESLQKEHENMSNMLMQYEQKNMESERET